MSIYRTFCHRVLTFPVTVSSLPIGPLRLVIGHCMVESSVLTSPIKDHHVNDVNVKYEVQHTLFQEFLALNLIDTF